MSICTVYTGTYTNQGSKGIYRLALDKDLRTLTIIDTIYCENPSYQAIHPKGNRLYSVMETEEFGGEKCGGVSAYEIESDGSLKFLNARPAGGRISCHISVSPNGQHLFVGNYRDGVVMIFPLMEDGSIGEDAMTIVHQGSGPDPERQEAPHVHFTDLTPDQSHLCVVDLGLDALVLYPYDPQKGVSKESVITVPAPNPGGGFRHGIFTRDGRFGYFLCEMGSMVEAYAYGGNGQMTHLQSISTLPDDFEGENTGAAIRISADGKRLYASNRGHDSVATFTIGQDGHLTWQAATPVGGQSPRDILPTQDGRFLLTANQFGGGVTLMEMDAAGVPKFTGVRCDIPAAVSLLLMGS